MQKSSKTQENHYALLSVFDKTGIVEFAKALHKFGYKIISTGGTAKVLQDNNIPLVPIQEVTGNPESFDGRMKTISFQIESGILFDRTNKKHVSEAKALKIKPIDIVVCNLYPFEQTISDPKVTLDKAIENIDIGGPTMVRAAAKNYKSVLVVVDPLDYESVISFCHSEAKTKNPMKNDVRSFANAQDDMSFRKDLAAKAFGHCAFYDAQVANYLTTDLFPTELALPLRKTITLRYGENPHQAGAIYMHPNTNSPLLNLQKQWGRGLSHVNVTDINAGLESVRLFKEPSAAVIKHNSPCGLATGKTAAQALERAIKADPESAFGGIIVLNSKMDISAAQAIGAFKDVSKSNIDIVAVPSIDKDALEFLQNVRKTMGIYTFGTIPQKRSHDLNLKWIDGGLVIQTGDNAIDSGFKEWKVVTKKKPTAKQLEQMKVAWKFISKIRSNTILIMDKDLPMTRGIGSGQTSRIRSTQLALTQAGKAAKGAVLASDSFFPFDDSVKLAAKAGIGAIVQQGGSVNDKLSIEAADKAGIAMVFTGRRAFWH